MSAVIPPLSAIRTINETSAFNRWCGIEVESAEPGKVEISMPWRGQVFTACELYAQAGGEEKLVATGETLLTVVKASDA